jgi:phosphonatase-like hydrolase
VRRAVDLVIFDLAGTTVRDNGDIVGECLRAALAQAGLETDPAAVKGVMGLPKPEAIRRLVAASPAHVKLASRIAEIHADFAARMRQFYASDPFVAEIPGAAAAFARCRAGGIRVALDTGFSRDILDVVLARLGWRAGETIDASLASDEVARGRPHPDLIHRLMEQLGVHDASRVAKVGDTPADLEEGTRAGCGLVIGVTQGSHTRGDLLTSPHTHLVETVREVPALLLP